MPKWNRNLEMMTDAVSRSGESNLAVVTGATKGIGLAMTGMLLKRGCKVIGAYGHDDNAAETARAGFGPLAGMFVPVKTDLSDVAGIEPLMAAVAAEGSGLRYIISNVGVTDKTPFTEVSPQKWEWVLRTNLTVPFFLIQRLFPEILDDRGRVVFIGSAMGIWPHPMSFSYGTSKAGLHFLAKCLVKSLSPRGITVNVVAPGFVDTSMQAEKAPDHRKRVEQKISLRRFALPEEVAAVVESLLEQKYVTGQVLGVDGGYDCE